MDVLFISEVSSNHNRDLDRCFQFIDQSSRIGCYAIKFQLFRINELFSPQILNKSKKHREREKWELPLEFLPRLAERCKEKNIKFACTPFYLKAVEQLYPYIDFYKISSYELLWDDLLRKCAETDKPIILSTGMANLDEINHAINVIIKTNSNYALNNALTEKRNKIQFPLSILHCISKYPALPEECNLAAIETIYKEFGYPVGWSDHSVDSGVIYRVVHRWKAKIIEFHLDLDEKGYEFNLGHCWNPGTMETIIKNVNNGIKADGENFKEPHECELEERNWRADPSDGLRPLKGLRTNYT